MSSQDTSKKNDANMLDFTSFIKKYYYWYQIDAMNADVISSLGLWANRNPKFNEREPGWHIDRGLLVWGNPGSGKDEIFRILNKYLKYLRSPYRYDHAIVWEFAGKFSSKDHGGYQVFADEGKRNRYYEELALTDESTGLLSREYVQHFGNKLLIGAELIHITHNAFKNLGIQSHFSTNLDVDLLKSVYGERVYSRLRYMCNFVKLFGKDRRVEEAPVFLRNINQPPAPPPPKELSDVEVRESKMNLEQYYLDFLENKAPVISLSLVYNMLVGYGVQVASEDVLRNLMEQVEQVFVDDPKPLTRRSQSEIAADRKAKIWERAQVLAVQLFFQRLKDAKSETIFGVREVDVDEMISKSFGPISE
jgi:hypothetical protein